VPQPLSPQVSGFTCRSPPGEPRDDDHCPRWSDSARRLCRPARRAGGQRWVSGCERAWMYRYLVRSWRRQRLLERCELVDGASPKQRHKRMHSARWLRRRPQSARRTCRVSGNRRNAVPTGPAERPRDFDHERRAIGGTAHATATRRRELEAMSARHDALIQRRRLARLAATGAAVDSLPALARSGPKQLHRSSEWDDRMTPPRSPRSGAARGLSDDSC
jgi:hypothetical protein